MRQVGRLVGTLFALGLVVTELAGAEEAARPQPIPGTQTDETLQHDVTQQILKLAERRLPAGCNDVYVTPSVLVPAVDPRKPWVEQWSVRGCGVGLRYRVTLTPDPGAKTGTTFEIQRVPADDDAAGGGSDVTPSGNTDEALK